MSDYDFSSLNDKEFESLSNDILSAYFGQHIERFKSGKDGGIDGRFFSMSGCEVVIQYKHWIKSGLTPLLRSIEKTEADKVRQLDPSRYIFATSLELSRANKLKIKSIFSPYILRDDDIFGNEDLNDLLSKYPDIERKHYKLWITSANVLKVLLNSAIVGRSRNKLEEIVEESCRYVMTKSHNQAMEKLEKMHSIIITGSPGVGKTSLADQLCQYYVAHGFELCFIENSLNEAESHYSEESKQVFYFDDFLGRNFLLALNNHQDSQIVNFISRVNRDPKKRFILTSRSNVLNQGKKLSDLFEIKKIDRNEYEVSIDSLTAYDKAKILYNHIWFSQLDDIYIDEIYKNKRYLNIINHENYNPRLISFITDSHRLNDVNSGSYWDYIQEMLGNPKGIWKNVFEVQMDSISRHIVIAVAIQGVSIEEEKLKEFYFCLKSSRLCVGDNSTFDSTVRLLVGALLNRHVFGNRRILYTLFNPSIADYVISSYIHDIGYLDELMTCLNTTATINNIHSLCESGGFDILSFKKLLEMQLIKISKTPHKYDCNSYLLTLLEVSSGVISPGGNLLAYIEDLAENILTTQNVITDRKILLFIIWVIDLGIVNKEDLRLLQYISKANGAVNTSIEWYISLSKIIVLIEPEVDSNLSDTFKINLMDFMSDNITSDVIDEGIFSDEYEETSFMYSDICDYVQKSVSEVSIKLSGDEIGEIADYCDTEEIIQANIDSSMPDDDEYDATEAEDDSDVYSEKKIDDLFERC